MVGGWLLFTTISAMIPGIPGISGPAPMRIRLLIWATVVIPLAVFMYMSRIDFSVGFVIGAGFVSLLIVVWQTGKIPLDELAKHVRDKWDKDVALEVTHLKLTKELRQLQEWHEQWEKKKETEGTEGEEADGNDP